MNLSLTQLEYLVAIDTYKSFNLAAKHCFVTQPTLSMQIQKLEETLGVILFDRSRQPVITTPIGEKIIIQAKKVLAENAEIFSIASEATGAVSGDFRLGIIPTISPYLLPRFLKDFTDKFPEVNLNINELQTDQIVHLLHNDEMDAGIMATPLGSAGINEQPLYYEPFVAHLPEGHALLAKQSLTNHDISAGELLLLDEGHCFRNQALQICTKLSNTSNDRVTRFGAGSLETLRRLSEQGFGITLLPFLMLSETRETGHPVLKNVRQFAEPVPTREVSLVSGRTYVKRNIMNALVETIQSCVPKELLSKKGDILKPLKQMLTN